MPLVVAMQEKQAARGGVVLTTPLTTVANVRWGIPAGLQVNVTWVYLSRLGEWEDKVVANAPEMGALIRPSAGSAPGVDFGETVASGPYKGFPHFGTSDYSYSAQKANLLADLAGWGVLNSQAALRSALR